MDMFLTGCLVGTNCHIYALSMMKKSYSHRFLSLFKTQAVFGSVLWCLGTIRNSEAKNIQREVLRENIKNRITKLDQ